MLPKKLCSGRRLEKADFGYSGNSEISEKLAEWIKRVLKDSHAAETEYHAQALEKLDREYQMIQKRVDALYDDKLDEKITEEFYKKKLDQYQGQLNAILNQKNRHQSAGVDYYELGTSILELSRKAVNTYLSRSNTEKRQLLQILLSNLYLKDGNLSPVYHPAFQILAEKAKNRVWLGGLDAIRTAFQGLNKCVYIPKMSLPS